MTNQDQIQYIHANIMSAVVLADWLQRSLLFHENPLPARRTETLILELQNEINTWANELDYLERAHGSVFPGVKP